MRAHSALCLPHPARCAPPHMNNDFSRSWPNTNGDRVVKKPKSKSTDVSAFLFPSSKEAADAVGEFSSRRLLVGLLISGAVSQLLSQFNGLLAPPPPVTPSLSDLDPDGDAVTVPVLETRLLTQVADGERGPAIEALVGRLEERGGSQLFASSGQGKWVVPWVGGWERVWASQADATFLGGPASDTLRLATDRARSAPVLSGGSTLFNQASVRQFVYGPGQGGFTIEYVYTAPEVNSKLLLTRAGGVTNLGGNYFRLEFPRVIDAYEISNVKGADQLATGLPLQGSVDLGGAADELFVHTTYLSERMWILRDEQQRAAVFQRTETRSVMDTRGLVADGQLRPPADETIRYGRLLFSESLSDYAGWTENVKAHSPSDLLKR